MIGHTDIATEVSSWLDDTQLMKLYLVGLIPNLSSFATCNLYWHSRTETLCSLRVEFCRDIDWRQTYQLLKASLAQEQPSFWNDADNATVCIILDRMKLYPLSDDVTSCCAYGTTKILTYLLTIVDLDLEDCIDTCIRSSQPEALRLLLLDNRTVPDSRAGYYGPFSMATCTSMLKTYGTPVSRQIEVVKIMLEDGRITPTEQELYHCNVIEIVQLYLADKRIDPTIDNCQPLQQAIRNSWTDCVRVYLSEQLAAWSASDNQRVVKLVTEPMLTLAKKFGTDEIVRLVETSLEDLKSNK
ncbi:Hypothetical protein POVR2_LOCUS141 [uncultured virus]|nr:Hypothetical protein POVR2_LOCUS141 [uncultured virus]